MIALLAALLTAAPAVPAAVPCTPENSIRTTVTAIGDDLEGYMGRCVTLSGPASSIALFSGVEGLYRTQRFGADGNPVPRELRRHRIGLYSRDNAIRSLRPPHVPWMTVTGTVDTCERKEARAVAAAGKDGIVMMGGYCHYYGGAVIDAAAFSVDPGRTVRRLVGERARREVGDLAFASADWPHLAELQKAADEFRTALRSGDREKLAELHDIGPRPDENDRALLDTLVEGADSPFAEIRRNPSWPTAIFIGRHELERARAGSPPEEPFGTICFCRGPDCRGRWPISRNDADNDPARPYACTRIVWRDWARRKLGLDTALSRGGWLAEPTRSNRQNFTRRRKRLDSTSFY